MTTASVSAGSRFLWLFSGVLCLGGAVLIVLGLVGTSARSDGDLVGLTSGDTVSVSDDGMSIWSPALDTRTETVCTLGEETMLRPVEDHATTVADAEFFEVARTSEQTHSGTYVLACDTQDPVYAGPYGPTVAAPGLMGATGLVVGILVLALGMVSMALAWVAGGRASAQSIPTEPDPGGYTLARRTPVSERPRPGTPGSPPTGPRYDELPPPS